jgi:N-acetylglutamate synthase/N-acetylornithine aminotransferase
VTVAAQIILIVDGVVMRDDGDVIRHMVVRIQRSADHLDLLATQVASRRFVEDTELAALRTDLASLQAELAAMLRMDGEVVVPSAEVEALMARVEANTVRVSELVPDEPPPSGR